MTSRFARLAAGAAVGVALMTAAAPAMASEPPEPRGAPYEQTTAGGSVDVSSVALGALSGIALSGAGLGIAYGVQRRRDRSTAHPA